MKIIVPCAGASSRFPNMRPKWMLNLPNGNLMISEAIKGLKFNKEDLIITILKEHEEKYSIINGLKKSLGFEPNICILDEKTRSQSETVYKTIKKCNVNGAFLVKDSDNYYETDNIDEEYNYICIEDLNNFTEINPSNKSYVIKDSESDKIECIVEKRVVSSFFSVGGYYFKDANKFYETFERLNKSVTGELYLSNIISDMIDKGEEFKVKNVHNYLDWGTLSEWDKYKQKFKVYFIDIDGVIFRNAAQYFAPQWGETEPLEKNVEIIKKLKKDGNQIILATSRTEEFRKITEASLEEAGIEYDNLIMGCMHAQRIIINDFSKSNPYPSAVAININRDFDDLGNYIK